MKMSLQIAKMKLKAGEDALQIKHLTKELLQWDSAYKDVQDYYAFCKRQADIRIQLLESHCVLADNCAASYRKENVDLRHRIRDLGFAGTEIFVLVSYNLNPFEEWDMEILSASVSKKQLVRYCQDNCKHFENPDPAQAEKLYEEGSPHLEILTLENYYEK